MTHTPHLTSTRDEGITVLELMIVLVIMSLIGVVATSQVMQQFDRAKVDVAVLQLRQIQGDLELFKIDTRRYPTGDEGLQALVAQPTELVGWRGPYARGAARLVDPWGTPLRYEALADDYRLSSWGADRRAGGTGTAADVVVSRQ